MEPGLRVVFPLFQRIVKMDNRVRNRDLPRQMVITRDNVTAAIDAVVYYKVVDAEKAALNVENYELAVKDRAKVVLRDIVGEPDLDTLLSRREEVAAKVRLAVEQFVAQWGLHVELVALQDIQLPQQMQEVIAKKAIAERDKQYVIIKSQADVDAGLKAWETVHPTPTVTVADVANHIEHVAKVAGYDHVGIGGDMDGIDSTPTDLIGVQNYPNLFAELIRRGWSDENLSKLAGGNILRALRQAEVVSASMKNEPAALSPIDEAPAQ
jgi:hypothetical protein